MKRRTTTERSRASFESQLKRIFRKNTKKAYRPRRRTPLFIPSMMAAWLIGAGAIGCTERFDPFNGVDKFRILSLKAEPPVLTEGQRTVITPLIYSPDEAPITLKWSWCPIAASSRDGGGCVVNEETLKELAKTRAEEQVGEDVADLIDDFPFNFDLGTGPSAQFFYAMPADLLASVCSDLISEEIPSFTGVPQCGTKFDVVIRLEATQGETTLQAVKEVPLFIDESLATNRNPEITDVEVLSDTGRPISSPLIRGRTYDLRAVLPDDVIDSYTPIPTQTEPNPATEDEVLFMTWYVNGGETEFMRTTYIEDEVSLDVLEKNSLEVPNRFDHPDDVLSLFLVIQDEQGGAGWLVRDFDLKEE